MFKNKIARRLSLYFTVALLVFSIIIGGIFMLLFGHHNIEVHKMELLARAESIASTLAGFIDNGSGMMGVNGYGPYLHLLRYVAGADAWIVDQNQHIIVGGTAVADVDGTYEYADLPENADVLVKEVFAGDTAFSENFSGLMQEATLTVGTPIALGTGEIIGVVLLHSSVRNINKALTNGLGMLSISIVAALLIAIMLSVRFSVRFTKPLGKINDIALQLAEGDYSAKNGIRQDDEIGQLAGTMDILSDRLDQASKQSAKLEQLRRDFVANISHELRTPVTVIRGSLEALVDKVVDDPEKVDAYHRKMLGETMFLQRLVGDLLDLSRLQNVDFVIEKRDISLLDVVGDVIGSAAQISGGKRVSVAFHHDDACDVIHADYGRVRQMLMIVLDNAIKFSLEGGEIEVTLKDRTLSICDRGIGIDADDLPYIFDRFYKARVEQNKAGTGLGLAIAREIAHRHDIGLSAQSADGATFIFSFPKIV